MIYTVRKGDTLWDIAKAILGRASRYAEIVKLNGIKTATLYPGQRLRLPQKEVAHDR